jgi:predicted transcriptional regulator
MKTLTVTISDEAAEKLAEHAAENKSSAEAMAARVVEDAYAADWLDELGPEDRAAVEEGLAQAERGEFASDDEVNGAFDRFQR